MLVERDMLTLFFLVAEYAVFDLGVARHKHAAALQGHHPTDRFAFNLVRKGCDLGTSPYFGSSCVDHL